ncbi:Gfo/Idh/MocA family protein [Sphingobacterium daejeonense]|uniref:Gfo/Idh/MocA family protein n=2 Tax=Sphingobacterium daejeonense TaxID=371142 RepID=A0ABW3RI27_9SPHI|nr:Gfo/Idh/MocA family oxidoreductase [Sphingobacterium daejeonense]MCT1530301.1 Gfo/Idh/MocA family oxidoreductase [Sphingobacterium daejeonense]
MDRRNFIKNGGILLGATSLDFSKTNLDIKKKIKVGLIGCGGRGTGAAFQALEADPDVEIVALADIFPAQLEAALASLKEAHKDRVNVPEKRKYIGFDAYKKLIASNVDVVLLTSPPSFRPDHLAEAVKEGKHIFCEKPMAVDVPGVHKVRDAVKVAKDKKLNLVSGYCFRYSEPNRELAKLVHAGNIGDIYSISTFRLGGELTEKPRQPDWNDLTYQLYNWFFYQRYSGDIIVEQTVHSIDFMNWMLNRGMPKTVSGTGGRQSKPWDKYGNVYDHFAIEFDYGDGVKGFHFGRQQNGTQPRNSVEAVGTKGNMNVGILSSYEIKGQNPWKYSGKMNNMYQTQHDELFRAIRNKEVINDGDFMADSTLLAVWAREAAYTGKIISLDEIENSTKTYGPSSEEYSWEMEIDNARIPRPGLAT